MDFICVGRGRIRGGGVTGAPGYNAAKMALKDWKGGKTRRASA